jgi:hypothetical protein
VPAARGPGLKRDEMNLNRHRVLGLIEHDLFGKPLHTFPDHALVSDVSYSGVFGCCSNSCSKNRTT